MIAYAKERDEALWSLDEKRIKAFLNKYRMDWPENDVVFWAGVYKAVLAIVDTPEEVKVKARAWLDDHHMSESIG
nr:MAG TPA: hypothetical protein [Caudoviricetes sp.]